MYGPYIPLPRGKYRATFRLKVNDTQGGDAPLVRLEVTSGRGTKWLAVRTISMRDFDRADRYQNFPLDFYLIDGENDVEFRLILVGGNRRVVFEYVRLSRKLF
jgi:hypothetical protein